MTYDVKLMYEMDMYLNNIYLDFEFVYLFGEKQVEMKFGWIHAYLIF